MKLFDLHADTAARLFHDRCSFSNPTLHLSLADVGAFESHTQVFACFTRPHLTDEAGYYAFLGMRAQLLAELAKQQNAPITPILAVEDARILGTSRRRLLSLHRAGVRIITLLWKGETQLGGAFDTDRGLTDFGKALLCDMQRLGIVADASHASEASFWDFAEVLAEGSTPFICSHSNSYKIMPHRRNLTDEQFLHLCKTHALCGISLCTEHLSEKTATRADALRHIEHYLALGGEHTVALGTDFDGIPTTPEGISSCRDLLSLAEDMARVGYPDRLIENVFYKNAEDFFRAHTDVYTEKII